MQVVQAVQASGYQVRLEHSMIPVKGMHCAGCVGTIERALQSVPGVVQAQVNLATEQATVTYVPSSVEVSTLRQAITRAGYEPLELPADADRPPQHSAKIDAMQELQRRFLVSLGLSLPVVVGSMGAMLSWMPAWLSHPLWLFALATPVQFWAGWPFYQGLWSTLKHRTADMNTLIALGTSAAYLYSVAMTFLPGLFAVGHGMPVHVYYETSVVIITLIILGRLLEARARGQTSAAIRALMGLDRKRHAFCAMAWPRTSLSRTSSAVNWCWYAQVSRSRLMGESSKVIRRSTNQCSQAKVCQWRKPLVLRYLGRPSTKRAVLRCWPLVSAVRRCWRRSFAWCKRRRVPKHPSSAWLTTWRASSSRPSWGSPH